MSTETPSPLSSQLKPSTVVVKGTVRPDQRSISWRAPALFTGAKVERKDTRAEVQELVDDWGV